LRAVAAHAPPRITLENLTLTHERRPAVHHLSGAFPPGSLTAVVGPNGAGKTTLLRAIAGLHKPHDGRLDRGGATAAQIGLLPQASTLDRGFPIFCRDVVALGALAKTGPFARLAQADLARADAALDRVGLRGFETRPIGSLSAGQFQRVLFARLIVQDAPVMLLDEPTAAVDARTEATIIGLIREWHMEGRTVVAVLHDLDLVAAHFPTTLLLAREAIAWGPTATVLTQEHRVHARLVADAWSGEHGTGESWAADPELCAAPHHHHAA
jgi:zinc/manganese transport system ATP-binding protein